jgi:glutamate N-acetyltransferase/amino-acid N-acetyltransferase
MTTDTRPKGASRSLRLGEHRVNISGVAKGAGMINPNMATMLAFVATDAAIDAALLDEICRQAAGASFNRITIDGDTSTNDACVLIASGRSTLPMITSAGDPHYQPLLAAMIDLHQDLARQIVKDAEGATKFVEVEVGGGANTEECLQVAYAIAHSPLVKTALFASDPNWGRIVAAIGYAGVPGLDASLVSVWLDEVCIVAAGGKAPGYSEEQGQRVFKQDSFSIRVDLRRGDSCERLWTSDLSHEYVRINAEYTT